MENVGCMLLSNVVECSYWDVHGLHVHVAPSPITNPSSLQLMPYKRATASLMQSHSCLQWGREVASWQKC